MGGSRAGSDAADVVIELHHGSTGPQVHADIQRLDTAWNATVLDEAVALRPLVIDASKVTYIDQELLPFLLGTIRYRQTRGLRTLLRVEHSDRLSFMRAWSFPEAVEKVTGTPFEDHLDQGTRDRYAALKAKPSKYLQVETTGPNGEESLLPIKYFGLTPLALGDPYAAAAKAREKYLNRRVVPVLDRYLGGHGKRIATRLVQEGVLNSGLHTSASRAFVSSQLLAHPRPTSQPTSPGEREFVLSIWDDGASYASTLLQGLKDHGTIRSPAFGATTELYNVTVIDRPKGSATHEVVKSSGDINFAKKDHITALAAFFLGVTATPFRQGEPETISSTNDGDKDEESVPQHLRRFSGLGLHIIRRTAVDQFGGTLSYTTDSLRIEITKSREPDFRYDAKLLRLLPTDARVQGNLLTARFRLRDEP